MTGPFEALRQAQEALNYISPNCTREQWVRIGQAIQSEFGPDGFELFDNWSRGGDDYKERSARDTYKSFKAGGKITIRTLYWYAQRGGYCGPRVAARPRTAVDAAASASSSEQKRIATVCKDMHARWPDASSNNAYLQLKGLLPVSGMKQEPNGNLVVPVCDLSGNIRTLQFIRPDGRKSFKKGGVVKGGLFAVGGVDGGKLLLCEGVATAVSLNLATGLPAIAAFSKSNLLAVAGLLQERYADVSVTICADNDRFSERNGGVDAALEAAFAIGGLVAVPAFAGDTGTDFDDLRAAEGCGVVRAQVEAAMNPNDMGTAPSDALGNPCDMTPQRSRFRVRSAEEIFNAAPMSWIVRGVLPADGLAAIYGPSGSGKSFLALDVGAAIASGIESWFGYRVRQVPVTYVGLEGERGFGKRLRAWSAHHRRPAPATLRFISDALNLRNGDDIEQLAASIIGVAGNGGIVIIDTLNRAAVGADENSSSHMGEIIEGAKRLQRLTGGLVLLVHHTGKEPGRGLRGHSSLHAALDAAIEVTSTVVARTWKVAKSKDDADGAQYGFSLQVVQLGMDGEGERMSSCVVVERDHCSPVKNVRLPSGKRQRAALSGIMAALDDDDADIDFEAAVSAVKPCLDCAEHKRSNEAKRVVNTLVSNGFLELRNGRLRRV